MKQCEFVVDRLLTIASEVASKRRNVIHAKTESDILKTAADAAFRQSQHMKLQRITPRVKFFDAEMPKPDQPEDSQQKVTAAAKTLAKAKKTKAVISSQ
jgi:hypothetical protein